MPANEERFDQIDVVENEESRVNPEDMASLAKEIDWEKLKNIGDQYKKDIHDTSQMAISEGGLLLDGPLADLGSSPEEKLAGQELIKPVHTEIEQLAKEESDKIEKEVGNNEDQKVIKFSKCYHHPDYRTKTAEQILQARKSGQDAEVIRQEFYKKTASEKKSFEAQDKERSVSELMKEKDLVVVHGIPLSRKNWMEGGGDHFNNKVVDNRKLSFEDSYDLLAGLEGAISTSIPSPQRKNNGLYYKTGVILGEGKILSAKNVDSGSVAIGIDKRIPKFHNDDHKHSAIQPEINLDETIDKIGHQSHWNELVVENPKVAGLYIDLSLNDADYDPTASNPRWSWERHGNIEEQKIAANQAKEEELANQQKDFETMRDYSKKMDTPLYVFKKEQEELKKFRVDSVPNTEYVGVTKNDLLIKQKEILAKNNNNPLAKEVKEFNKEAGKILRIISGEEYVLSPITSTDILEAKRNISDEERIASIKKVVDKGILNEQSKKEINKKLNTLKPAHPNL